MAFHTNWIREAAIKVPFWVSGADASVVEDPAGSRRGTGTISHESNNGTAVAFGGVCFLHIPGDAVDGRFCGVVARDAPRLHHFLSLISKRPERIRNDPTSIHVLIPGAQGRTSLENLFVSSLPRPFPEHPDSVAVLCAFIAGHGCVSNERDASALAAPLRRSCGYFPPGGRPCAGVEYDPVSFALQDRVRLLDSLLW